MSSLASSKLTFEISSKGHSFVFCDPIALVIDSTLKETIEKTLNAWIRIYSDIPEGITSGEYVASSIKESLSKRKICFIEDKDHIIQSISTIDHESEYFKILELVVAPWNAYKTRSILNYSRIKTLNEYGIKELALRHQTTEDGILNTHVGSGALMILALATYAKSLKIFNVQLFALKDVCVYYEKIGGSRIGALDLFLFDLKEGIPKALTERTSHYSA
jgi:hypothetical protein